MAGKRVTLKDVTWVEFEPRLYLEEWLTQPEWTAQDFGAYFLIEVCLYAKQGKCNSSPKYLAALCRLSEAEFTSTWERIAQKFETNNNELSHRKVTLTLQKARRKMQVNRTKGVMGAKARWPKQCPSNAQAMPSNSRVEKSKVIHSKESEGFRLASLLGEIILARKPDYKQVLTAQKNNWQGWAVHIEKMLRLDNRKPDAIKKVIEWCQADAGDGGKWGGWQNNVLSTATLRSQFDRLELAMRNSKPKEALKICVVDRKVGYKYSPDNSGRKVWLCGECYSAWRLKVPRGNWGHLPKNQIEKLVLEGKRTR